MTRIRRVFLLLLLLILAACTPNRATGRDAANPAADNALHSATRVELARFQDDAGTYAPAGVIEESDQIAEFVTLFDTAMPLGPVPNCVHDLQIRFVLDAGRAVEFGYGCAGDAAFLVGGTALEQGYAMTPPQGLIDALAAWMQ